MQIGGNNVLGAAWSDDFLYLVYIDKLSTVLEAVEKSFSKHDKELQPKKALLIPMWKQARRWVAMNGGRITEVREDETHCLWKAKNNKYRIGDTPLPIHQSAKLLGKLVGPSPERHTNQTGWARKKTKSAIKTMGWMGAFAKETDNRVVHMLYTYLVESVIVNAVLNTHLNERDSKSTNRNTQKGHGSRSEMLAPCSTKRIWMEGDRRTHLELEDWSTRGYQGSTTKGVRKTRAGNQNEHNSNRSGKQRSMC